MRHCRLQRVFARVAPLLAQWTAVFLMVFSGMSQQESTSLEVELYKSEARSAYLRWLWTSGSGGDKEEGGPWKAGEALTPEIVGRLLSVAGSQTQASPMVRRVTQLLSLDDAEAAMRVAGGQLRTRGGVERL